MRPIQIAIIDDGISVSTIPDLCFNLDFTGAAAPKPVSADSHGSTCAAIIRHYSADAIIGSIKVLDNQTMKGSLEAVICAVEWCIKSKVRIIHMSIGSVTPSDFLPLTKIIDRAFESGAIIISACKNGANFACPASLPTVIGVKTDKLLEGNQFSVNAAPTGGIDFLASSRHSIDTIDEETQICNSYAAPVITARVYSMLKNTQELTLDCVRERLFSLCGGLKPCDETPTAFSQVNIEATESPVIVISGNGGMVLAHALEIKFLEKNYFPLLLSSDADFLGSAGLSECTKMVAFYAADLMIVVTDRPDFIMASDICLDCTKNRVMVSKELTGKLQSSSFRFNNEDALFEQLMEILVE